LFVTEGGSIGPNFVLILRGTPDVYSPGQMCKRIILIIHIFLPWAGAGSLNSLHSTKYICSVFHEKISVNVCSFLVRENKLRLSLTLHVQGAQKVRERYFKLL
jgi:hypothetical protein